MTWESVGAGKIRRRTGKVVGYVLAGRRPGPAMQKKFGDNVGQARAVGSYVVVCGETGRHYWPLIVRPLATAVGVRGPTKEG